MKHPIWTPAEDAYLAGIWRDPEHEKRLPVAAEVLGRSPLALRRRALGLGLAAPRRWTAVTRSEIQRWRASTASTAEIARAENRPESTISLYRRMAQ